MIDTEAVWALAMPGLLVLGLVVFMRIRRRTRDYAETRAFKGRLPPWVALVEQVNWLGLTLLLGAVVLRAFFLVHGTARPEPRVEGADAVYAVIGAGLIALPIAMLCANGISWITPPLRRANERAMSGLSVSFAQANRGLLLFGAISVPLGLIDLVIATIEPWAR
jgi:hypothetical protein